MALLTKDQILDALNRLAELATAEHVEAELMVFGGGVMVLEFGARAATRDVDALILSPPDPAVVRRLACDVARGPGWPDDWLNDAVKGFVVGAVTPTVLSTCRVCA